MASYPNVNAANRYAREVVAGKITACLYVRQAAKRHLDDLAKQKAKAFPYRFNKDAGERICEFIQHLTHTKGKWATRQDNRIILEPWQKFILVVAFGWLQKKNGLRRFIEIYIEVPRKNGKSIIAAGIGIYMLCADGEYGAEVYSGATSEKQAWEVFKPAKLMCARNQPLREHFGIEVNASNINIVEDASKFEPLIGNPGDGASPSCAIADEVHEHRDSNQIDTMLTGMGSRDQPVMLYITTAGDDIAGPCYDKRGLVIDMLKGVVDDPQLFGIIYTLDEGDDWKTDEALKKANPNYGVSFADDYLQSQQRRAINSARFQNKFKTKHLNLWVSAKEAFFNLEEWQRCEDKSLSLEQFAGEECILSFDLAAKLDLTAMVRLFTRSIQEDDKQGRTKTRTHYYCIAPRFWVPEDTIFSNEENSKLAERYKKWVNQGVLIPTDGAEIDYRDIEMEALDAHEQNAVSEAPIDPHGATALGHKLDDHGMNPITIIQNYTNMSDGMLELEAAIKSGRFHHDGNPIMTWCISNVIGKYLPGSDDVVRPVKQKAENKIDGAVALIMGVGRAFANSDSEDDEDGLAERGLVIL